MTSVKLCKVALIPVCIRCPLYLFFLAMDLFQQIIHSAWENPLCDSIRVPQILLGLCPWKTKASQG